VTRRAASDGPYLGSSTKLHCWSTRCRSASRCAPPPRACGYFLPRHTTHLSLELNLKWHPMTWRAISGRPYPLPRLLWPAVPPALRLGPGGRCSPRHRVPNNSRYEGSKCLGGAGEQYPAGSTFAARRRSGGAESTTVMPRRRRLTRAQGGTHGFRHPPHARVPDHNLATRSTPESRHALFRRLKKMPPLSARLLSPTVVPGAQSLGRLRP